MRGLKTRLWTSLEELGWNLTLASDKGASFRKIMKEMPVISAPSHDNVDERLEM